MKHDEVVFLKHIMESIESIETYMKNLKKVEFVENRLVQDAIIRRLEIIGEAAKNLGPDIKKRHASIPWKDIMGMRDKLIHGYFGVDVNLVWDVARDDLPALKQRLVAIIHEMDGSG